MFFFWQIEEGTPGKLKVIAEQEGEEITGEYNTVIIAIGRDPCTQGIGLENTNISLAKWVNMGPLFTLFFFSFKKRIKKNH